MSRNGRLPSVPGYSIVNFMSGSTEFRWLKRVPLLYYADDIIHVSLPPWNRYGAFRPSVTSLKYST